MRALLFVIVGLLATPVAADPVPRPVATVTAPAARPGPAPAPCQQVMVGRGRDRHRVCKFSATLSVSTEAPRPKVLIVHPDGRAIVGRPRTEDRLAGLPQHLD